MHGTASDWPSRTSQRSETAGTPSAQSRRVGRLMADEAQALVQSLVERAQAGDGGAFGELYEQFAPEIFR